MLNLDPAVDAIRASRSRVSSARTSLVAVTGIDGCGKGYVAEQLKQRLEDDGSAVAVINIDGWLNLPGVRFNPENPAEHFYAKAIRFADLFAQLLLPLRDQRRMRLVADFSEETRSDYRKHLYAFDDVDIILVEGIYLLKQELRKHYDASFWIDCTFETALERAVTRAQEGLSPEQTARAYRTIYFPAQEIHFRRDAPRKAASIIIANDPRLALTG